MAKLIEQNNQWPGGGAFEEDILRADNLLKEAQTGLVEVGQAIVHHLCKSMDIDVQSANNIFDQAYHILNLMYNDTKKIRISLGKGESQTRAIKDLEMNLKKFVKHCEETRCYLLEAAKMQTKILTKTAKV